MIFLYNNNNIFPWKLTTKEWVGESLSIAKVFQEPNTATILFIFFKDVTFIFIFELLNSQDNTLSVSRLATIHSDGNFFTWRLSLSISHFQNRNRLRHGLLDFLVGVAPKTPTSESSSNPPWHLWHLAQWSPPRWQHLWLDFCQIRICLQ